MSELLKVLDMGEREQVVYLQEQKLLSQYDDRISAKYLRGCLADLAFRLRDEAMKTKETKKRFHDALYEMQVEQGETEWATAWWGYAIAKPIHWIIAALIAKENKT